MKDKILDIVAEHCVGWKNCEALTEKLFDLYSVRLSLPDSEEITEAAMEYAEIDGTTDEYDESVRDAAHFVAGATWYHNRIKGNGA